MLRECLGVMEFFDLADVPRVPWKNGGGNTQELVCWPLGAGMDDFEWRVSVATIATPGPFSAFAGIDRQIMLLQGDGVLLQGESGRWEHALDQPWQPFAFSGDEPVDCRMLGGTSTDFNLMQRRGAWSGTLQVLRGVPAPAAGMAGLCMVLQGTWQWRGDDTDGATARVLKAGQGVWWMDANAGGADGAEVVSAMAPWVVPSDTQNASGAPVLAWVALRPAVSSHCLRSEEFE